MRPRPSGLHPAGYSGYVDVSAFSINSKFGIWLA
jgi:hypothetical protein